MLFLHMPKTGGSWVTQAVSAAGVATWAPDPLGDRSYSAHGHADLHDVGVDDRLSVAFIRHPLDWWRSYWGHRMRAGWDRTIGIDAIAANDDFNRFVLALLDHHRGSFDEIVRRFVGLPSPCVDFVGRFENLVEDTCEALRLGGERFSASAIRQHPRVNVNDYRTFPALYRREVAVRLAEAEHQTIERFYADDPIPAISWRARSPTLARRPASSATTTPTRTTASVRRNVSARSSERSTARAKPKRASNGP
jgi:hypothetical protein